MSGSISRRRFKTPRGLTSNRHAGRPDRQSVRAFALVDLNRLIAGTNRRLVTFVSPMTDVSLFIHKLRARHALSSEEESAIRSIAWEPRRYARHEIMVRNGERLGHSILLLSGFAFRSKAAADGSQQIVETNVAGDFVDLHGFILKILEHEVSAASACEVALAPHGDLKRITEKLPRLTRILWFQTMIDAAIHREWMLVLGKKRSRARIAQFFCEMQARLELGGLTSDHGYDMPFSQQELADITGMTPVHLNRSLKELREAGLVTYRNGKVELHDLKGLARVAQFDPLYLHIGMHDI
jgi:CRP-like cAMP-binding protein